MGCCCLKEARERAKAARPRAPLPASPPGGGMHPRRGRGADRVSAVGELACERAPGQRRRTARLVEAEPRTRRNPGAARPRASFPPYALVYLLHIQSIERLDDPHLALLLHLLLGLVKRLALQRRPLLVVGGLPSGRPPPAVLVGQRLLDGGQRRQLLEFFELLQRRGWAGGEVPSQGSTTSVQPQGTDLSTEVRSGGGAGGGSQPRSTSAFRTTRPARRGSHAGRQTHTNAAFAAHAPPWHTFRLTSSCDRSFLPRASAAAFARSACRS